MAVKHNETKAFAYVLVCKGSSVVLHLCPDISRCPHSQCIFQLGISNLKIPISQHSSLYVCASPSECDLLASPHTLSPHLLSAPRPVRRRSGVLRRTPGSSAIGRGQQHDLRSSRWPWSSPQHPAPAAISPVCPQCLCGEGTVCSVQELLSYVDFCGDMETDLQLLCLSASQDALRERSSHLSASTSPFPASAPDSWLQAPHLVPCLDLLASVPALLVPFFAALKQSETLPCPCQMSSSLQKGMQEKVSAAILPIKHSPTELALSECPLSGLQHDHRNEQEYDSELLIAVCGVILALFSAKKTREFTARHDESREFLRFLTSTCKVCACKHHAGPDRRSWIKTNHIFNACGPALLPLAGPLAEA